MIRSLFTVFFLLVGGTFVSAQSDDDLIKVSLQNYMEGGATGDTARIAKAFFPLANLRSLKNGVVTNQPVKSFIGSTPKGGAKWNGKIVSYSYCGTAGTAVLEMEMENSKFVDFLALLKFGSDWKIVSRVFTRAEKDQAITAYGAGGKSTGSSSLPTATNAKKPAAKKPKSDDGWD